MRQELFLVPVPLPRRHGGSIGPFDGLSWQKNWFPVTRKWLFQRMWKDRQQHHNREETIPSSNEPTSPKKRKRSTSP